MIHDLRNNEVRGGGTVAVPTRLSAGGFLRLASKVPVVDGSLPPAGWVKHVRRGADGAYKAWVTRDWPSRAGLGSVRRHRVTYVDRDVAAAYAAAVASQRAVQACVAAKLCAVRIQKWVSGFREAVSASAAAAAAERAVRLRSGLSLRSPRSPPRSA